MLQWAGMFVIKKAVGDTDLRALALLVQRRVAALESKLVAEGHAEGLGGGDFSYAEVRPFSLPRAGFVFLPCFLSHYFLRTQPNTLGRGAPVAHRPP